MPPASGDAEQGGGPGRRPCCRRAEHVLPCAGRGGRPVPGPRAVHHHHRLRTRPIVAQPPGNDARARSVPAAEPKRPGRRRHDAEWRQGQAERALSRLTPGDTGSLSRTDGGGYRSGSWISRDRPARLRRVGRMRRSVPGRHDRGDQRPGPVLRRCRRSPPRSGRRTRPRTPARRRRRSCCCTAAGTFSSPRARPSTCIRRCCA